jgi:hypothetical protein
MSSGDTDAIQRAERCLNAYPVRTEEKSWVKSKIAGRVHQLNPKRILGAVLKHAPTEAGKASIAKTIVKKAIRPGTSDTVYNAGIESFAREIIWNLLVPSLFFTSSSLTVVQANGGHTPRERSSAPSNQETSQTGIQGVKRRGRYREQVISVRVNLR